MSRHAAWAGVNTVSNWGEAQDGRCHFYDGSDLVSVSRGERDRERGKVVWWGLNDTRWGQRAGQGQSRWRPAGRHWADMSCWRASDPGQFLCNLCVCVCMCALTHTHTSRASKTCPPVQRHNGSAAFPGLHTHLMCTHMHNRRCFEAPDSLSSGSYK